MAAPLVAVIMGSKSDWEVMRQAAGTLTDFGVPHECRVLSAHRTPAQTAENAGEAESRGIEVIDRKSVVEGKRVDLGGRRIIKKKKTKERAAEGSWGSIMRQCSWRTRASVVA